MLLLFIYMISDFLKIYKLRDLTQFSHRLKLCEIILFFTFECCLFYLWTMNLDSLPLHFVFWWKVLPLGGKCAWPFIDQLRLNFVWVSLEAGQSTMNRWSCSAVSSVLYGQLNFLIYLIFILYDSLHQFLSSPLIFFLRLHLFFFFSSSGKYLES